MYSLSGKQFSSN